MGFFGTATAQKTSSLRLRTKTGPLGKGSTTLIFCREDAVTSHRYNANHEIRYHDQIRTGTHTSSSLPSSHNTIFRIWNACHLYSTYCGTGSRFAYFFTPLPRLFVRNHRTDKIEEITREGHIAFIPLRRIFRIRSRRPHRQMMSRIASPRVRPLVLDPHPKQYGIVCIPAPSWKWSREPAARTAAHEEIHYLETQRSYSAADYEECDSVVVTVTIASSPHSCDMTTVP